MLSFLTWFLFGRSLQSALGETRTVFVHGVRFRIKKIDPMAHLTGGQVLQPNYAEYVVGGDGKDKPINPEMIKKVRQQMKDTFMEAVVFPKLTRKPEEVVHGKWKKSTILVDNLLTDWGLCTELFAQITLYSHGKKKLRRVTLPGRSLLNSI